PLSQGREGIGGLQLELVELLQDAIDLGEHILPLLAEGSELRALRFEGLQPGVQPVPLSLELRDRVGRPPHCLLELGQPPRQVLAHHVPGPWASNRLVISLTIRAWTSLTSASVSVRSGAWNMRLHARLRRSGPTWLP